MFIQLICFVIVYLLWQCDNMWINLLQYDYFLPSLFLLSSFVLFVKFFRKQEYMTKTCCFYEYYFATSKARTDLYQSNKGWAMWLIKYACVASAVGCYLCASPLRFLGTYSRIPGMFFLISPKLVKLQSCIIVQKKHI